LRSKKENKPSDIARKLVFSKIRLLMKAPYPMDFLEIQADF